MDAILTDEQKSANTIRGTTSGLIDLSLGFVKGNIASRKTANERTAQINAASAAKRADIFRLIISQNCHRARGRMIQSLRNESGNLELSITNSSVKLRKKKGHMTTS